MSKWDSVRESFERAHNDLFDAQYTATFYSFSSGSYDPNSRTGGMTGQSRSSYFTREVEIVPPAADSTVDLDGTSISWTTSIRFPNDEEFDAVRSNLNTVGVESEKPSEVELTDHVDNSTETYELHSYSDELGSGMVMCRLVG